MLKIREDFNIKELEKYGFKPRYDEYTGEVVVYEKICEENEYLGLTVVLKQIKSRIRIFKKYENEKIWIINNRKDYFDLDTLYDLIKADIVVKE